MSENGCSNTSCSLHAVLKQYSINLENFNYVVALTGNPNTGKSTVFNALTGLRQHTGNWPGKTVTRAEGMFEFDTKKYKLIDLPGTYSLLSMSQEEEITRDFLLLCKPDVTVIIVDATSLERNLNFVLQILEITPNAIVCLNLMDEAKRKGVRINEYQLEGDLGVPVIPTVARYRKGLGNLVKAISGIAQGTIKTTPHQLKYNAQIQNAINILTPLVEKIEPGISHPRWIAMRLLDGDRTILNSIGNGEYADDAVIGSEKIGHPEPVA